jgi:hypothetical protein
LSKTILESLGREVWQRIGDGDSLGVRQGEVTLTDHVLLEIRRRRPPAVHVRKIGPALEPKVGADFDLWVRRGQRFRRYLVQAKRLERDGGRYKALGHKVNGTLQATILGHAASVLNAVPAYALYNHRPGTPRGTYWHCCQNEELLLFGWTVVRLARVQQALKRFGCRTFDFLHQDRSALPIRCLLCRGPEPDDLARWTPALLAPHGSDGEGERAAEDDVYDGVDIGWHESLPIPLSPDQEVPVGWDDAAGYEILPEVARPTYALIVDGEA